MDLFKSKVPAVMLQVLVNSKEADEINRRKRSMERMSIYLDDWDDILERNLSDQFVPENYKNVVFHKNKTQNLVKKIINQISLVYKEPPSRTLIDKNGNFVQSDVYDNILGYLKLNSFYKTVNRYTNLLNDVMIYVGWDSDKEQVRLSLITPGVSSVIQNEYSPNEIDAVCYNIDRLDTVYDLGGKVVYWDKDTYYATDSDGVKIKKKDNPGFLNPFGELPFVIIHREHVPGSFWNDKSGDDFISGTIITGLKNTFRDYLFKTQSFKQPYYKLQNKGDVPSAKMRLDPLSALSCSGKDSDIRTLDLQVNFKMLDDSIGEGCNAFLSTYGLTLSSFMTSPLQLSGKAIEAKNRQLLEVRQNQIDTYRDSEMDLFDIIRMVNNYHADDNNQIPEDVRLLIDYPEIEINDNPEDKRRVADHDLKTGLISLGQYFMRFNPDYKDEKKAEAKMIENLNRIKKLGEQGLSIDSVLAMASSSEQ